MTLSRYIHDSVPTRYVVVTVPRPPERVVIETLAGQMGLTASEAKVASLMQTGLSNKQAAELAGFTDQTFNTYSKRVLNKLNVSCRAELARLLTWQANGGTTT